MNNKYYILQLPNNALDNILTYCVESISTLRRNIDGKKCVIKLPIGAEEPNILNGFIEYTYENILLELNKPEWTPNF